MATITFKDGSTLEVEMNATSLIADEKPIFPSDLSEVVVTNGEETHNYVNTTVNEAYSIDGRYWFYFMNDSALPTTEDRVTTLEETTSANSEDIEMLTESQFDTEIRLAYLEMGM